MEYAVSGGVWHWRDRAGSVAMDSVMGIAQYNYLQEYFNNRDNTYRAAEGRPPYWTGTNVAFAHACWKGRPKALRVAKKFTLLVYHKSYTCPIDMTRLLVRGVGSRIRRRTCFSHADARTRCFNGQWQSLNKRRCFI